MALAGIFHYTDRNEAESILSIVSFSWLRFNIHGHGSVVIFRV
jgi:hypothetical protein